MASGRVGLFVLASCCNSRPLAGWWGSCNADLRCSAPLDGSRGRVAAAGHGTSGQLRSRPPHLFCAGGAEYADTFKGNSNGAERNRISVAATRQASAASS